MKLPHFRSHQVCSSANLYSFTAFMHKCYKELEFFVPFDGDNLFVAGGFFIRKLFGLKIRDVDVYVNQPDFESIEREYINSGYAVTFKSFNTNYTILTDYENNLIIDLIGFHPNKHIVYIDNFDFNLCQIALSETEIYIPSCNSIDDFYDKKLKYTGYCYKKTISRLAKYLQMGFTIDEISLKGIAKAFENHEFCDIGFNY